MLCTKIPEISVYITYIHVQYLSSVNIIYSLKILVQIICHLTDVIFPKVMGAEVLYKVSLILIDF